MKHLKIKILTAYNAAIVAVMGILGLTSSCSLFPRVEYGSPHATFELSGKVTSSATNEPIGNIRIVLENDHDTIYTNHDGTYKHSYKVFGSGNQTFKVKYKDIDGTENGEFQSLDTIVRVKPSDFKGKSGNWYIGTATKEIDVSLKPKE